MYKEKAVGYFDRHPSSNECHITSDGRVFHTIGTAQGFAGGLKDNKVESFTRAQIEVEAIPVVDSEELTGNDTPKDNAPKDDDFEDENIKALKAFDPATTTYEEGKALIKALGIETPSNTRVDIFAALEAAKANLESQA